MRILLTGSSGWLGQFLAPALVRQGHKVVGLDPIPAPTTSVLGSVSDKAVVQALFDEDQFDGVIHAGALHKPDMERYSKQQFIDVNIAGTLNLLEAAVAHKLASFVFTSTTSLMITQAIWDETSPKAVWLDEQEGLLLPRNIYGVTKRSAEELCRLIHAEHRLPCIVLRTSRFFPEEDDTHRGLSGENMKANELLYRRLTVEDCAEAHIAALEKAPAIGFGTYIVSAPPPFQRDDCAELKTDAAGVIRRYFPEAAGLYDEKGWALPTSIGRVYDPSAIERDLGFRCKSDFATVLDALRRKTAMPFVHDVDYVSPNALSSGPTHSDAR
jgi:nucleoside-diphosphate-sugar epimerase